MSPIGPGYNSHFPKPSFGDAAARVIYDEVMTAIQNADELGGVEDVDDYIKLMEAIAAECMQSADNARNRDWD